MLNYQRVTRIDQFVSKVNLATFLTLVSKFESLKPPDQRLGQERGQCTNIHKQSRWERKRAENDAA